MTMEQHDPPRHLHRHNAASTTDQYITRLTQPPALKSKKSRNKIQATDPPGSCVTDQRRRRRATAPLRQPQTQHRPTPHSLRDCRMSDQTHSLRQSDAQRRHRRQQEISQGLDTFRGQQKQPQNEPHITQQNRRRSERVCSRECSRRKPLEPEEECFVNTIRRTYQHPPSVTKQSRTGHREDLFPSLPPQRRPELMKNNWSKCDPPSSISSVRQQVDSNTSCGDHESNIGNSSASSSTTTSSSSGTISDASMDRCCRAPYQPDKIPSYRSLLTMKEVSRQSWRDCTSPVHSDESLGNSIGKMAESDGKINKFAAAAFHIHRPIGGNDLQYFDHLTENTSNDSNDVENVIDDNLHLPDSGCLTDSREESSKALRLPFSDGHDLIKKQIQNLQQSSSQIFDSVVRKQPCDSDIHYITNQLKQIKQQREIIHRRVKDEGLTDEKSSSLILSSGSNHSEASAAQSSHLDVSVVGNSSSLLLDDIGSLHLSDIESKK